jgi:hypothetical protein
MTDGINPFTVSDTLADFVYWCGVDPDGLSFDQAIEWSIVMEEWDLALRRSLIPTACIH